MEDVSHPASMEHAPDLRQADTRVEKQATAFYINHAHENMDLVYPTAITWNNLLTTLLNMSIGVMKKYLNYNEHETNL